MREREMYNAEGPALGNHCLQGVFVMYFHGLQRLIYFIKIILFALTIASCAIVPGPPPAPPDKPYVPEFLAVWNLLADRQGVTLGAPVSADSQGQRLIHFQQFREQDGSISNSAEMHDDGCIYVAY